MYWPRCRYRTMTPAVPPLFPALPTRCMRSWLHRGGHLMDRCMDDFQRANVEPLAPNWTTNA